MITRLTKTAAILAFIIGAMAIFAGGQVIFGKSMDYFVIDWLPMHNFIVGILSAFITAVLIWKSNKFAMPAAIITFISHITVLLILLIFYKDVVDPASLVATIVRIIIWSLILILMKIQTKNNQQII